MAVNDSTASSRQLAARWSTVTGVLMSALSIRQSQQHRGLRCKGAFIQDPHTANHRLLRLQRAHEHRASQADRHKVVFSHE
ncbi:transposable element Tcb2 transposase [Trichonephila clavipes]|nr:transposable element Tcb2 transposase [Trichonephila clavipes]